jgi:hypothetical protein
MRRRSVADALSMQIFKRRAALFEKYANIVRAESKVRISTSLGYRILAIPGSMLILWL